MTRTDLETFLRETPNTVPSQEILESAFAGDERAFGTVMAAAILGPMMNVKMYFGESQLRDIFTDGGPRVVDDPLTTYTDIICAAHNLYLMDEITALRTRFQEDSDRILAEMV